MDFAVDGVANTLYINKIHAMDDAYLHTTKDPVPESPIELVLRGVSGIVHQKETENRAQKFLLNVRGIGTSYRKISDNVNRNNKSNQFEVVIRYF